MTIVSDDMITKGKFEQNQVREPLRKIKAIRRYTILRQETLISFRIRYMCGTVRVFLCVDTKGRYHMHVKKKFNCRLTNYSVSEISSLTSVLRLLREYFKEDSLSSGEIVRIRGDGLSKWRSIPE